MRQRQAIAVLIGLLAMAAALAQPLWIRATGDEITLDIAPVDPLSLFRGNYVDLRYDVPLQDTFIARGNKTVYVVVDDSRPAEVLRFVEAKPDLANGEFCIRGRVDFDRVSFPNLEQFFVTEELGRGLENSLDSMVAVVKVTGGCRAVLVDIQPR
jgi:uncharacterized membrane-anchored protein